MMMLRALSMIFVLSSTAQAAPLDDARSAWATAWAEKPDLVSLGALGNIDENLEKVSSLLSVRLKGLGRKTFSNREWKAYWQRQQKEAHKFEVLLRQAEHNQMADGMRSWAKLAEEKISNQDIYLAAIETERDALEKRLEASLSESTLKAEAHQAIPLGLSPFQLRQAMTAELEHDLASQERRTLLGEQALALIERQNESTDQMLVALRKDVALARIEATIATQEAASVDPLWAELWAPIAATSRSKVGKLSLEENLGKQRLRGLKIEATLAASQINYRKTKMLVLSAQIAEASSLSAWRDAIVTTSLHWLRDSLWKVILSLLAIWLLLKTVLHLIGRLSNTLEHVADDADESSTSQAEQRAGTIAAVFSGIAKVGAYALAVLTALEVIGINTGPIVGSVAILGLAVSFGSQNLVKDLVNGFFILIENQFAVGDVVTIGGATGTVEKINLRSTRLRQYDGTLHVIPNGAIDSVANSTRDWARVVVVVGVAYDSDLQNVESVINKVGEMLYADALWRPQLDGAPTYVGVVELADSSVNIRCIARTVPGAQWAVSREYQRRIKDAFDEAGIEIPFPQMVMRNA
jgi:small-conductance mechanosensitive channel